MKNMMLQEDPLLRTRVYTCLQSMVQPVLLAPCSAADCAARCVAIVRAIGIML
jgi:hypothetical protein